jgi:tetratricopeptide (TPR) repeat protein
MTQPQPAASSPVALTEPVPTVLRREQSLFTRRRYDQALDVLTALLARPDVKPGQRFQALCRKAECLENLRQPGKAVSLLREVVRAFPQEALGHSLLGEYLHRIHDDARGALRSLGRALRLSPRDPDTWWWKGQVFQHGLGEFRRARACYKAALDADPKYASAMDAMATLCEGEGKWIRRSTGARRTTAAPGPRPTSRRSPISISGSATRTPR